MMETSLKNVVQTILQAKLGKQSAITIEEWNSAISGALQDVYANRFSMLKDTDSLYFVDVLVNILVIMKKIKE